MWTPNSTEYYSQDNALMMMQTLKKKIFTIVGIQYQITFPIRAVFTGVMSEQSLERLFLHIKKISRTNVTMTIWSDENDEVDAQQLVKFIKLIGVDKVFVNVPEKVWSQMDFNSSANSLCQLSIINFVALSFVQFFRNVK